MQNRPTIIVPVAPAPQGASGDFTEVNAFDRAIWQDIYRKIHQPAVAQAVFDLAERLPVVEKLYPSLLVRARQTLIEAEQRRIARAARATAMRSALLGALRCVRGTALRGAVLMQRCARSQQRSLL